MGMSIWELDEITPRALFNKLRGFRKLEKDQWEQMRIQTWFLIKPYDAKNDYPRPPDMMPLPWDGDIKTLAKVDAKKLAEDRKSFWEKFDKENNKIVG